MARETHDTNNNGIMEVDEYRMESVSLNRGVNELEVDLPRGLRKRRP